DRAPLAERGDVARVAEVADRGGVERRRAAVVDAEVPVAVRPGGPVGARAAEHDGDGAGQGLELRGEPRDRPRQRGRRRGWRRGGQAGPGASSTRLSSPSRPDTSTIFATALPAGGRT